MTNLPIPASLKKPIQEAVKALGVVLVVLGALPAIAQAAGVAHIVVPASVLGYAAVASTVLTGVLAWLKDHGVTPASVVASVAHRTR